MYRRILLVTLLGFSIGHIVAQQRPSATTKAIGSSGPGTGNFFYADRNEPPRAIVFEERTITASYFVANINRYFNIPNEFTFIEAESNVDRLGMKHRLLQQHYKGIPLEGLIYRMHEKNGFMSSVNGKGTRSTNINVQTVISEQQAFNLARQYLNTKDTTVRQGKKLIVSKDFTFSPESFSIAFQFDIDVSLIEQWRISIDARTGEVINKVSLVNTCFKKEEPPLPYDTGTGLTNYYGTKTIRVEKSGNFWQTTGQTEHGGSIGTYNFQNASMLAWTFGLNVPVYVFTSSDNTFNLPTHKAAVSVQWAAEQAYEYYFTNHGRNSFDNNGSMIRSYVHVDKDLNNAFWSRNTLLFGDGSNNNPLVELDVVSHELTHGVTQYEARLQYSYEPGALNESFSDIFGKAVEFKTFGNTATWQLAKHYRDGGLRDMSNPNLKDQPDTYFGDMWYTGYEDNGGVHYNSGVQNFWFYLLCEGGSGVNDHEMSYSVNSIGMDAATKIAYRNLTEYLSPASDYLDSRIGSLLATADLYGKNSVTYQEVDKAWDAVGVIDEPIIISLEHYDITATTVKLKGSLLPRGDTVTYHFEYGTTPTFGSSSSVYKYTNKVEGVITGLQSQTKYYVRLVATNENGNSYATTEFTTISLAPLVKLRQRVDATETTATLYGLINPNSLATSFYFEYGLTPALGLVTPSYQMSDTTEFLNISASIINLQPRQTYYYKLVATNSFTSSSTESASFFTAVKPVISSYAPVAAPIGTEITITGQNFNSVAERNWVSFGATRATVLSSSSTEIKVKVPAGASFGSITLLDTESGLAAKSVLEFVPTFTGDFKRGDLQLRVGIKEPYIWKSKVQDMDGDNKPDIVGIHYEGFSIFQNVNQGGDITEESFVRNTTPVPGFYTSTDFQVIDLDGNGLKDIIGRKGNSLRIYPNFSVPGYIFFGAPVDLPIGNLRHLAFDDFDQDGRIDISGIESLTYESQVFTIIRNQNPKGLLLADNFERQYTKILPYYIAHLTSGDLNNDGKPDIMVGADYRNFLSILKNNSHPKTFEFEESIVQDETREDRYIRYFGHDLNHDGWKDIISHSPELVANIATMENMGTSPDITLAPPTTSLIENGPTTIQPADMNGDGKIDLIVGLKNRRFVFLKNKVGVGEHLSSSSFEKFEDYGLPMIYPGDTDFRMTINDLNGDGRPEVINEYSYGFGPHDEYQMEIWQNAPANCPDPSLITLDVSNNSATIVLPPNTTFDQFEIEYAPSNANYWWQAYSTTLSVYSGTSYKLRVRAKCYLGFTEYYYINFTTNCYTTPLSISSFGIDKVVFNATNYYYEVQYSQAGKNQWVTSPLYSSQITNLLPGTTYDLRMRGNCNTSTPFKYSQFTTLCPKLNTLTITNILYNKADVSFTSSYTGSSGILEYSGDNTNWTLIDESRTMSSLTPGKQYFVRGRMACTNLNSDFIYQSFSTPCPKVSTMSVDNVTPYDASINWVDDSNTGRYTITYSRAMGGMITTLEMNSTSFTLTGLNPGTQYKVSVAPYCIGTKDFTLSMFTTLCYSPSSLLVNAITHTTAELSWSDDFGGFPYFVDYSIAGSTTWLTKETTLTGLSLKELRPGTEYEVRVHINCLSVTAPYLSQRFETDLYEETTFAPNPTDSYVTIYPSKNIIGNRYSIHDSTGKQVANGEFHDYTIDLSIFRPGVYILKIEGEKTIKIVKY